MSDETVNQWTGYDDDYVDEHDDGGCVFDAYVKSVDGDSIILDIGTWEYGDGFIRADEGTKIRTKRKHIDVHTRYPIPGVDYQMGIDFDSLEDLIESLSYKFNIDHSREEPVEKGWYICVDMSEELFFRSIIKN